MKYLLVAPGATRDGDCQGRAWLAGDDGVWTKSEWRESAACPSPCAV